MRRLLAVGCTLALLAALIVPVAAQPVLLGPGGLINSTTASVAVTNTVTATTIYTYTVPAGFTQNNFSPLHLSLVGRMTTNASPGQIGAFNIGCNYGGSTASIALVNGQTPTVALTALPVKLDLWLNGYASQAKAINGYLQGRFEMTQVSGSLATAPVIMAAQTDSLTLQTTPQVITCVWQWGSAAATNSVVFTNGKLVVGN